MFVDSLAGTVINDRYELIDEIGRGNLGIVYKARHKVLDRIVAVKVLFEQISENENGYLRFHRAVQAVSSLSHQNIVKVFDFGVTDVGYPFEVMDFVEGANLSDLLMEVKRLEVKRAAGIFVQICDAMDHAHEIGVIHRDLKPSNIILTNNVTFKDFVRIVDFGIAKRFNDTSKQKLTMEGQVIGTPAFMSPEQVMGKKLDGRSDIYALGCLMFTVLTGLPPISGESPAQTMAYHVTEEPLDFRRACPDSSIPATLQWVITKTLKKSPDERHQTMGELRQELQIFA